VSLFFVDKGLLKFSKGGRVVKRVKSNDCGRKGVHFEMGEIGVDSGEGADG